MHIITNWVRPTAYTIICTDQYLLLKWRYFRFRQIQVVANSGVPRILEWEGSRFRRRRGGGVWGSGYAPLH